MMNDALGESKMHFSYKGNSYSLIRLLTLDDEDLSFLAGSTVVRSEPSKFKNVTFEGKKYSPVKMVGTGKAIQGFRFRMV